MTDLKTTPLNECHREAGARLVDFAGWEMPVLYTGVIEEHRAVRGAAGLFDVSHMGEVSVRGSGAEAFLQHLTPNDVSTLEPGRAQYSGLLTERGTYLDDLLVYRMDAGEFLMVVNAANRAKDFDWIASHAADAAAVEVEDVSDRWALLALQGPAALDILSPLVSIDVEAVRYYGFARGEVDGVEAILSRTGYTGEDGYELYLAPDVAPGVWRKLLAAGEAAGLVPAGLGARDTLRLEAGLALYGHELDETTTPLEARLGWTVKLDKGEFIGRDALLRHKEEGVSRKLVGFEVEGRRIARQGYPVVDGGEPVGAVTSGTFSPTFEKPLGMAYVPVEQAGEGSRLTLEVRGREVGARVVKLPFYRRSG